MVIILIPPKRSLSTNPKFNQMLEQTAVCQIARDICQNLEFEISYYLDASQNVMINNILT